MASAWLGRFNLMPMPRWMAASLKDLENQIIGFALAFSSGSFVLIALSDLLPEVQFHRHDRMALFLALLFGIVLMGMIALLEGHKHPEPATYLPSSDNRVFALRPTKKTIG